MSEPVSGGAASKGRVKKVLVWTVVFFVALMLAGGVHFWLRPLSVFQAGERWALGNAGLSRRETPGTRGPLVYWAGGSGPTVVLLHGANDQAGAWAKVVPGLARTHRVLVLDLPGHGDSDPAGGALSVGDLLAGVEALLDAEAAGERVSLVGNSMGGWLALLYAHRHPGRVAHVVLVNGAALRIESGVNLLPRNRAEARQAMDAVLGPSAPPIPGFVLDDLVRRSQDCPLARLLQSDFAGFALDGRLHEIATPVSLLWGEADGIMPLDYARRVADALPAARLQSLPGCGHVPQRECSEALEPLLLAALEQPPPPSIETPPEEDSEPRE